MLMLGGSQVLPVNKHGHEAGVASGAGASGREEDCISRMAKQVLDRVELAHNRRYTGLGQAVGKLRREAGHKAAKFVRSLNEAAGMVRHLTTVGEESMLRKFSEALGECSSTDVGASVSGAPSDCGAAESDEVGQEPPRQEQLPPEESSSTVEKPEVVLVEGGTQRPSMDSQQLRAEAEAEAARTRAAADAAAAKAEASAKQAQEQEAEAARAKAKAQAAAAQAEVAAEAEAARTKAAAEAATAKAREEAEQSELARARLAAAEAAESQARAKAEAQAEATRKAEEAKFKRWLVRA